MSISFRVLGTVQTDNALLVRVDSGQAVEYLMFDCGEGCFHALPFGEKMGIDHLFFSHLHMDHVAGFDSFFRCTFNRNSKVNRIWGPPGTVKAFHHRFRGFLWNLHEKMDATWLVSDILPAEVRTSRFELKEAFATEHLAGQNAHSGTILDHAGYRVEAIALNHAIPSIGYVVREKAHRNIDLPRLAALGFKPGPWIKDLKDPEYRAESIQIAGVEYSTGKLRADLIRETPGDSVAYLTDFTLDEAATEQLAEKLAGCKILVCEAQYRHVDLELAERNFHMTATLTARLAARAKAEELILIHLSDRYQRHEWPEILQEARAIFPKARYPEHW